MGNKDNSLSFIGQLPENFRASDAEARSIPGVGSSANDTESIT